MCRRGWQKLSRFPTLDVPRNDTSFSSSSSSTTSSSSSPPRALDSEISSSFPSPSVSRPPIRTATFHLLDLPSSFQRDFEHLSTRERAHTRAFTDTIESSCCLVRDIRVRVYTCAIVRVSNPLEGWRTCAWGVGGTKMAEAAPTTRGWGRFRGIRPGGGLHTTDTRAPAGWRGWTKVCADDEPCVRARMCTWERETAREKKRDIGARYTSVTM